ncbi:hypothetical protein MKD41_06405 [Lutibacter sp. A64]|uniref:hypothetical protein n=1 Tax=Lutibacter sp. A64 TaxID=2918526 RepID=UPI001F064DEF|nr:hypothetical protein [Lutibacter sp. A64]UMB55103.1 hypothetical protein MKD41_06405 [Lutibacter sp. A64]
MRNLLLIMLFPFYCYSQNAEIKPYVQSLKNIEKTTAKDYIIQQFKEHDIVILCERDHSDISQYELIKEILSDNYFKKHVKNVFTEIGVINLQPEITKFLKTRRLDSLYVDKKLNEFQQNASFYPVWERFPYYYFLRTIYNINNTSKNQISLYPSDSEFDWNQIKTVEDYTREYEIEIEPRDSIIAYNIINQYEKIKAKNNKKALIILNIRHAYKIHTITPDNTIVKNAGKYLSDYFGEKAVSILSNRPIFYKSEKGWNYKLIKDGKWDAAFKFMNIDNIGFDFNNSYFGNDSFDLQEVKNKLKYKNVFDGFVFYKTIEEHNLVDYFNGLISKDFEKEFFRRLTIQLEYFENTTLLEKLKDQNFREKVLNEWTTKRIRKYQNFEYLIGSRDKYLDK